MSRYNNSPFEKEKWDDLKSRCAKDDDLKIVWAMFEAVYSGNNKKILDSFDNFLDFAFTTIEIATGVDIEESDFNAEELIEMGDISNFAAMRKVLAKKILSNKDDKTFERLEVIMKNLADRIKDRENFVHNLSPDDEEDFKNRNSLLELAEKHNKKVSK